MNKFSSHLLTLLILFLTASCSEIDNSSVKEEVENSGIDSTKTSSISTITCPHCNFSKAEVLPTDVCQIKYECKNCGKILYPKQGDCCVFCSWGDHKCPSKQ